MRRGEQDENLRKRRTRSPNSNRTHARQRRPLPPSHLTRLAASSFPPDASHFVPVSHSTTMADEKRMSYTEPRQRLPTFEEVKLLANQF